MKTIHKLLETISRMKIDIPKRDPEWIKQKDKCLIEILKKIDSSKIK